MNKKRLLIGLLVLIPLVLVAGDYLHYANGKNAAVRETKSTAHLLPAGAETGATKMGCGADKEFLSVSFHCTASSQSNYPLESIKLEELFASYEAAGWSAQGTIKDSFIHNPSTLSSPACAHLFNYAQYPTEKVTISFCRAGSTVTIRTSSSYRPSLMMMLYLGLRSLSSREIQ